MKLRRSLLGLPVVLATGPLLARSDSDGSQWLRAGSDCGNTRFSPLAQVTPANAAQLKLVSGFSTGGVLSPCTP